MNLHFFKYSIYFILDIEEDFKTQLNSLVPELFRLDNENFIKEINGEQIESTDLFEYFKVGYLLRLLRKALI